MYINDVTDLLLNCAISKIFADDLKSYIPVRSEADLVNFKRYMAPNIHGYMACLCGLQRGSCPWHPKNANGCLLLINPAVSYLKMTL